MIALSVDLSQLANAGQAIAGLQAKLQQPGDLLKVLEREGVNQLKTHFRGRDTTPNALGGRRTHFWQQMADSTRSSVSGAALTISVTDPRIAQKVYGGTITPKRAKALTIPVNAAAYGRTAAVFEQESGAKLVLIVWRQPKGKCIGALAAKTGGGPNAPMEVFYLLMTSVNQAKDPDALPPVPQWLAAIEARARGYYQRVVAKAAGANPPGGQTQP